MSKKDEQQVNNQVRNKTIIGLKSLMHLIKALSSSLEIRL